MNYLLTLAYDGTNYCGFQVQPNGRSVAAAFQDALEAVLGSRPDIKGCSRTDAGVHALGFMLNFHADTRIPAAKLPLALNQHLPPDIRVLEARVVPDDFHARYAAHTKTYLYRIHNSPIDSPFASRYYTKVPGRLDAEPPEHKFSLLIHPSGPAGLADEGACLIFQLCVSDGRADGVGVRVAMPDDHDLMGCLWHGFLPPLWVLSFLSVMPERRPGFSAPLHGAEKGGTLAAFIVTQDRRGVKWCRRAEILKF